MVHLGHHQTCQALKRYMQESLNSVLCAARLCQTGLKLPEHRDHISVSQAGREEVVSKDLLDQGMNE